MADTSFSAQLDDVIKETNERIEAVMRTAVMEVIDEAQLSDDKGGKMRIKTGFLRASGQLSFEAMPAGPVRGEPKKKYEYDKGPVELQLANVEAGQTIFFGWTANYAAAREARDGFLVSALQNWQKIVDRAIAKVKAEIGG